METDIHMEKDVVNIAEKKPEKKIKKLI
jgi:hypothetical protein